MRNMSFSMTTEQVRAGTKTVTRRFGWLFLKPGEVVMAIKKGQGLKKGETVKRIRPIRIVGTRREQLNSITRDDCIKEGFPQLLPNGFIEMFMTHHRCKPWVCVTRIEFEYVNK